MAVSILIDENLLPEKGVFELNLKRMCQINITAEEARRQVHRWLIDEVSSNIGAEIPTLVMSERPVWRVPAALSFPRYGRIGSVGAVDVDVETGKMRNLAQSKAEVERHAEALAERLPSYQPRETMPPALLHAHIPPAPKLSLAEDEFLPEEEVAEALLLESVG